MEVAFPWPCRVASCVPKLEGLRHEPFVNIDGEPFARPTLNGFWSVDLELFARGNEAQMAMSGFVTSMSAGGTSCVIPIPSHWRPVDARGRRIAGSNPSPLFTRGHAGFASQPFGGYTLRAAAGRRNSYIDINMPALGQIVVGQLITLGDRLHQVVNMSALDEHPSRARLSLMPNLRDFYPVGAVVVVDQLRLKVQMQTGEPIDPGRGLFKRSTLRMVEAF
jgi:hypothetical protein